MFKTAFFSIVCFFSILAFAQEEDHSHHQMPVAPSVTFGQPLPHFELLDNQGNLTTLSDFRGQYLLLGFGFTNCAYVCPTMAANMAGTIREASKTKEVTGILISVDTERDSPAITHQYAQAFHKKLVGLSGSHEQVSEAAKNFKVNFAVTKTPNDYTVQHTANIYVLDPEGEFIDSFSISANPTELVAAMQ